MDSKHFGTSPCNGWGQRKRKRLLKMSIAKACKDMADFVVISLSRGSAPIIPAELHCFGMSAKGTKITPCNYYASTHTPRQRKYKI